MWWTDATFVATDSTHSPVTESLSHDNIGSVAGRASVNQGAAGYQIAIEVPPGRAGMQPDISLGYSSSRGNGWLGRGWSLNAAGRHQPLRQHFCAGPSATTPYS